MRNDRRRIAITGVGLVTAMGTDPEEVFLRICDGECAIRETDRYDPFDLVSRAAPIIQYDKRSSGMDERDLSVLSDWQVMGLHAAQNEINMAGLDLDKKEIRRGRVVGSVRNDFGVVMGTAYVNVDEVVEQLGQVDRNPSRVSPRFFNRTLLNSLPAAISIRFNLGGPVISTSGASAASAEAISVAYQQILLGNANVMIAGGAECPITPLVWSAFLSNHTGSSSGTCKPFDAHRDGTVLGEGAAVIVLEEYSHASRSGANILGEMLGCAMGSDSYHLSDIPAKQGSGLVHCLSQLESRFSVDLSMIALVNSHGTGTKVNDLAECDVYISKFGNDVVVNAYKGNIGHTLGASGAIETVLTLLSIMAGKSPPIAGLEESDCEIQTAKDSPMGIHGDTAITVSVGMGGSNVAIALRAHQAAGSAF